MKNQILIIGAGIVNLVSALYISRAGYRVTIIDQSPHPADATHGDRLGITHGGGDARTFSICESGNHICHQPGWPLANRIEKNGWVLNDQLNRHERGWIEEYQTFTPEKFHHLSRQLFMNNKKSGDLWQNMKRDLPHLFSGVCYHDGILWLCSTHQGYHEVLKLQDEVGAFEEILSPGRLCRGYPALEPAIRGNRLAGALKVSGFTLNIHKFVAKLITELERNGVTIEWQCRAICPEYNSEELVQGFVTSRGNRKADHYLISTGMDHNGLMQGNESGSKIQGVLGVWITLPHLPPYFDSSLKIHWHHPAMSNVNITLAQDKQGNPVLHLAAGYGYAGQGTYDIDSPGVVNLFTKLEEIASIFFPVGFKKARESGGLQQSKRICMRPWAPCGIPQFESHEAADGGHIICSGAHTTGGFTQAPLVAKTVLSTLNHNSGGFL